ncbi:MAG: FCD domain-containing protein, partial [Alphaproteobacteria bacterium]
IYEGEVARGGTLGGRNDFHMRIVSGAYHPRLSRLLNEDFYTLYRMWRANFEWVRAGGQRSWNDHQRILEALEQRDGELAEMMVRRHITRLREQAEENLHRMREPRLVGT